MEQINRFAAKPKAVKPKTAFIICSATTMFRMKTFGPKCLFNCKNGRLLDAQVQSIRTVQNDAEIVLTVGYMADKVIRYNKNACRIVENQLYENMGIAEEIRLGMNNTNSERVVIIDGDISFNSFVVRELLYQNGSSIIQNDSMPEDEPGIIYENGYASNLAYNIPNKWGQICLLVGDELRLMQKLLSGRDKSHLIFHELINNIITSGGKFKVVHNKEFKVNKINSAKALKDARLN